MYWNHRLMQREEYGETFLFIVEAYYNDDDNRIIGWTKDKSVWGESVEEILQTLEWMKDATTKPILIEADLLAECERLREMGADVHEVGVDESGDEVL